MNESLKLRYDDEPDANLILKVIRSADGAPLLEMLDELSGERIFLTEQQAYQIRDLIRRM